MKFHLSRLLASVLPLAGASLLASAAGCVDATSIEEDELSGSADSALSAAQCGYFDVNGKVQICHKTSSVAHPYTILRLSEEACINGHVAHGGDYVTSTDPNSPLYDPTCQGGGCLPVSAPCDATVPCCDGSTCTDGVCVGTPPDPCDGVTCVAIDDCHVAGTCDVSNGACSTPAVEDGTVCSDGSACTTTDVCGGGVCYGDGYPCQNGASCASDSGGYTCSCPPGWTGTSCEIDIDECESNPCVNGDCIDQIAAYQCECLPGWTGTTCDVPAEPTGYDCADNNPCTAENSNAGLFYFPASSSPSQFIQCSEWGECYTMSCPGGLVWNHDILSCTSP